MNESHPTQIADHPQYSVATSGENLVFTWKSVPGLSVADMARGITAFAGHCAAQHPGRAVIDARAVDAQSAGLAWVSGQTTDAQGEDYNTWWLREIVPLYNAAGIAGLAVATGNPAAPGELPQVPPGMAFKVGYFNGLDDALGWRTG